jgi:hypothetical protein
MVERITQGPSSFIYCTGGRQASSIPRLGQIIHGNFDCLVFSGYERRPEVLFGIFRDSEYRLDVASGL